MEIQSELLLTLIHSTGSIPMGYQPHILVCALIFGLDADCRDTVSTVLSLCMLVKVNKDALYIFFLLFLSMGKYVS